MSEEPTWENAPERVFMDPDMKFSEWDKQYAYDVEYIRADIHEARIKELEEQVKDERHVLKAWFNTRELAHEAIDAAVLDAAKGYLRTSRSGGMCQQESDIVAGVIKDMARLSVFADLFARAKMPLPSAPKERKENET